VNIVETANPDNELQLITDVVVAPNNINDSTILEDRLEKILEKTPDLNELHQDGAFGSQANDEICKENDIVIVQTGIKGPVPGGVPIEIFQISPEAYEVSCPGQRVEAEKTKIRWKAIFAFSVCESCEHAGECQLVRCRQGRVYYFDEAEYLKKKRFKNLEMIPPDRRTLRANVEATVSEFVRKTQASKLRVRGAFGAMTFAFSTAISINFGRIYRYEMTKKDRERVAEAEIALINEEELIFSSFFSLLVFACTMCWSVIVRSCFDRLFRMNWDRRQRYFAQFVR